MLPILQYVDIHGTREAEKLTLKTQQAREYIRLLDLTTYTVHVLGVTSWYKSLMIVL